MDEARPDAVGRLRTVTLPDWPELRERMLAPKPPIAFTAYAIGRDPLKVRYDDDGAFRLAETGTRLVGEAWITSAIEPQRFVRLRDAHGEVTGREEIGRPCVIAEVRGLRGARRRCACGSTRRSGASCGWSASTTPRRSSCWTTCGRPQSAPESGSGTFENTRHSTRS